MYLLDCNIKSGWHKRLNQFLKCDYLRSIYFANTLRTIMHTGLLKITKAFWLNATFNFPPAELFSHTVWLNTGIHTSGNIYNHAPLKSFNTLQCENGLSSSQAKKHYQITHCFRNGWRTKLNQEPILHVICNTIILPVTLKNSIMVTEKQRFHFMFVSWGHAPPRENFKEHYSYT